MREITLKPKPLYSISIDRLDIDCSHYRDYYLNGDAFEGEGNSLDEILERGVIFTCDQDGGEGPQIEFDSLPKSDQVWLEMLIKDKMAMQDDVRGAQ